MKYLLIQKARWSTGHEVLEFATAAELTAHLEQNGVKDAIIAQRIGVQLQVCDWTAPVEAAIEEEEAA